MTIENINEVFLNKFIDELKILNIYEEMNKTINSNPHRNTVWLWKSNLVIRGIDKSESESCEHKNRDIFKIKLKMESDKVDHKFSEDCSMS